MLSCANAIKCLVTAHYSEGLNTRKVCYSEGLLFRTFDSPKIKKGLLIQKLNKVC